MGKHAMPIPGSFSLSRLSRLLEVTAITQNKYDPVLSSYAFKILLGALFFTWKMILGQGLD